MVSVVLLLLISLAISAHVCNARRRGNALQVPKKLAVAGGFTSAGDTTLQQAVGRATDIASAANLTASSAASTESSSNDVKSRATDKDIPTSPVAKNKSKKKKNSKLLKDGSSSSSYGRKKYGKKKRYGVDVLEKVATKDEVRVNKQKEDDRQTAAVDAGTTRSDPMKSVQMEIASSIVYMLASRVIFKVNFNDKKTVLVCRTIFLCYLVLSQLLSMYLTERVNSLDNQSLVEVSDGMADLAGILAPNTNLPTTIKKKSVTVKDYDLGEVKKLAGSIFFEILSVTYMHFITKAGKPLLFVPLVGFLNKLKSPVFQVHILGFKPVGSLARPFQSGLEKMMKSFMPSMVSAVQAQADVTKQTDDGGDDETKKADTPNDDKTNEVQTTSTHVNSKGVDSEENEKSEVEEEEKEL